nr:MAG TPA: hypothetical protein [Caudoviricetes sp.]
MIEFCIKYSCLPEVYSLINKCIVYYNNNKRNISSIRS